MSFIYETELTVDGDDDLIATSIQLWRARLLQELEAAAGAHPPALDVDLSSLAAAALPSLATTGAPGRP